MIKTTAIAATLALFAAPAMADSSWAQAKAGAFKGGPNSAHGAPYGAVNKAINESIRTTGSYTSVHTGTVYTKPGAGNRK